MVTDTNRKQAFRWDTLTANAGYTETPSENPAKTDLSDSPVELFPGTGISSKTVATYVGAVNVTASSYGNSVSYTPEDQAYSAIDGNFDTAWITGTFVPDPSGQWWQAQFGQPGHDGPHHARPAPAGRPLPLGLGGHPDLRRQGPGALRRSRSASHATTGQTLTFPTRTFHTLRVTIDGTTNNHADAAQSRRRRGLLRGRDPGPDGAPGDPDADARCSPPSAPPRRRTASPSS